MTHLDALEAGLSHERARLAQAKGEGERQLRTVWVAQLEKEVATERAFLGLTECPEDNMSDAELLAALA